MPKGYWIARVDVHDMEAYKRYIAANAAPISEFGGRFLVRGGKSEELEGNHRQRVVVIEFDGEIEDFPILIQTVDNLIASGTRHLVLDLLGTKRYKHLS